MAYSSYTIWHDHSTASGVNAGAFDPGNQFFRANLTVEAGTGNTSAPIVSTSDYTFVAADVGHWLFVSERTGWVAGWHQVASVTAGKATLSSGAGFVVLLNLDTLRPNGLNTVDGVTTSAAAASNGLWGMDYSQQDSPRILYTDMVIDGTDTTAFTSSANPVLPNLIGNMIAVLTGTGFTFQRVQIVDTSSGQAFCDTSLGTAGGTGGQGRMGGCLGSTTVLRCLTAPMVAGNKAYVTGDRSLTSGGVTNPSVKGNTTDGMISIEGFGFVPGDRAGRPLVSYGANTSPVIALNDNDFWEFIHLHIRHTGTTRGPGFGGSASPSTSVYIRDCDIEGCTPGVRGDANWPVVFVEGGSVRDGTGFGLQVVGTGYAIGVDFYANNGDHIRGSSGTMTLTAEDCIFDSGLGCGINDNTTGQSTVNVKRCTFVNNVQSGLKITAKSVQVCFLDIANNIFWINGGYGIESLEDQGETDLWIRQNIGNCFGLNSTGARLNIVEGEGEVILTEDPFVDRLARDFRLNNVAGGGASVRAAGWPSVFPGSRSYRDPGFAQHQDTAPVNSVPSRIRRGGAVMKM